MTWTHPSLREASLSSACAAPDTLVECRDGRLVTAEHCNDCVLELDMKGKTCPVGLARRDEVAASFLRPRGRRS